MISPTQRLARIRAKANHLASGKVSGLGDPIYELSLMVGELCTVLLNDEKDQNEAWIASTEGTIR